MNKRVLAALCGVAIAGSAMALPTYTHVRTGSEPTHLQLLNTNAALLSSYGGNFASAGTAASVDQGGQLNTSVDVGFSNGLWTFLRSFDSGGSTPLDLQGSNFGAAQDTVWQDGVVDVRVTAKIAGDNHTFGWHDGSSANPFTMITNTVVGNTVEVSLSSQFVWGLETDRSGTANDLSLTSDGTLDNNGQDQMVSYAIFETVNNQLQFYGWLLAWEDRLNGDFDYNDAWLEVQLVVIPSPIAGALASVGLMGLAARRRR